MSDRRRALFDSYVAINLHDPTLAALPAGTHVFNLTALAAELKIPVSETIEEVGPLAAAIIKAKLRH